MRPAAGLQRDIDRRQLGKEPDQILPPQVPSQDHTTLPIHAMQRENRLGRINRNTRNLFHGRLLVQL
jgi:hypothetical protein